MGANSKTILSTVIGTLIAGAATTAVANEAGKPVFYGNFNISADVIDAEGAKTSGASFPGNANHVKVSSHNSRLGVTQEIGLNHGLTALIKAEVKLNADGSNTTTFETRETYVGVKGSFGQVIAGRINRPLRTVEGRIDQFNHLYGDINTVISGEAFTSNVVQYSAPKFGNTLAKVAVVAAEKQTNPATSKADSDGISASVAYDDGKLYAAFGYEHNVLNPANVNLENGAENINAARLGVTYNFGVATLGAIIQQQESTENAAGTNAKNEEFGYVVNGSYTINKVKLKAQYGAVEGERTKNERDYFAIGADYALGKGSYVYTTFTQINKDVVTATGTNPGLAVGEYTDKIFQIGFNQAF